MSNYNLLKTNLPPMSTLTQKHLSLLPSKQRQSMLGNIMPVMIGKQKMMEVRLSIFEFTHRIPQPNQNIIAPCPRCVTELVLLASDLFHIFRPSFLKIVFFVSRLWRYISSVKQRSQISKAAGEFFKHCQRLTSKNKTYKNRKC